MIALTLRLEDDMHEALRREAFDRRISVNQIIRERIASGGAAPMTIQALQGEPVLDICKDYAAGLLKRADLVRTLAAYEYTPTGVTDGYDSLLVSRPGEWSEVETAVRRGIIDHSIYEDVFNLRHGILS